MLLTVYQILHHTKQCLLLKLAQSIKNILYLLQVACPCCLWCSGGKRIGVMRFITLWIYTVVSGNWYSVLFATAVLFRTRKAVPLGDGARCMRSFCGNTGLGSMRLCFCSESSGHILPTWMNRRMSGWHESFCRCRKQRGLPRN